MKTVNHTTRNFIEVETDRGPMIIAVDKIACISRSENNRKECIIYTVGCDLFRILAKISYDEMKELLDDFGIIYSNEVKEEG